VSRSQGIVENVVLCDDPQVISAETEQIQRRIRERAYQISVSRGHAGREMDDWLTAESEIISVPPMEIAEKDDTCLVQLAAGGIGPVELTIMATTDQALVKGEFQHSHEPDATIHLCDFRSSMLFRTFRFPSPINLATLKTQFDDGVIRITAVKEGAALPKKAAAKKGRKESPKRQRRPAAS
jgi:HSP20 family molecular chaperone IbpA